MTEMKIIARIRTELPEKFGVPRQSGLVPQLRGRVVFEPGYRNPDAVRGLEDFSHIWLIWQFSQAVREDWSPTVRPPRLGGNRRMGVFATRSPFRPNAIGLSSVQLDRVELDPQLGPVLHVRGADLMDGTPIFDIKPYLAYTDSHPQATGGFTDGLAHAHHVFDVHFTPLDRGANHHSGGRRPEYAGQQAFGVGNPVAAGGLGQIEGNAAGVGETDEAVAGAVLADKTAGQG